MDEIRIIGLKGIPEIKSGDELGKILVRTIQKQKTKLQNGDIIIITSKIVSKAEGRMANLNAIKPSNFSSEIGRRWMKDPRFVEMILSEARRIVRMDSGTIIAETRHGFICANAGIDQSNVGRNSVVLLPLNADHSAEYIRKTVRQLTNVNVAVIISDTFGRPWRIGQVDLAIGLSGLKPIVDYRGAKDLYGYQIKATMIAIADELASAAELVMCKLKKIPVVIIKGYKYPKGEGSCRELIRHKSKDLFR